MTRVKRGDLVRKGRGRNLYLVESVEGDLAHLREWRTNRIDCAYVGRLRVVSQDVGSKR